MAYTVKQLAQHSGVSVRTLHFYDEIGLLKPAYYGDNNYRYYQDEQVLLLQQILFYRELGISLNDIQEILQGSAFDKIEALHSHRKILEKNIDQAKDLLNTIDKTIAHLRGKEVMKLEEIFHGFNQEKQDLYENFLVNRCGVSHTVLEQSKEKVKNWTKDQWLENKKCGDQLHAEIAAAIDQHLAPASPEVQKLIQRHYELTTVFWTPTKESYKGLAQLYGSHPDFVAFYENIHPRLLPFMVEAMNIYADRELL